MVSTTEVVESDSTAPAAGAASVADDVSAVFIWGRVGHAGSGDDPAQHVVADWRCVLRRAYRLYFVAVCARHAGGSLLRFAKVMAVMHLAGRQSSGCAGRADC